jgi:NAD(P)-dependent dehydrogenase (short-subunit alcohol dehydrogenase family)
MLISGGTSGIGLATARRMVAEGARVWLLGTSDETLEQALTACGEEAGGCACDVSREDAVERAVRDGLKFLGRLDAAFVNAGIDGQNRDALAIDAEHFHRVLEVNLLGAFLVARATGRAMDGGAIVFNASVNGLQAEANFADYNASKGGVVLLGRSFARDLGARGFWVTVVCPGYVRTRMAEAYLDDVESAAELVEQIPSRRFGEPDEVAALVSFLASPEAAYMNGSVVTIDGGRLA